MSNTKNININTVIDRSNVSSYQKIIFILLFVIATVDGFDVSLIAYIGPSIMQEWSITAAKLSYVFGASLLGLMLGSMILGPLADRIGSKKVLIIAMLVFSFGTLLSANAQGITLLTALRFITGLGLGGTMPICIALSTEYAPIKRRMIIATLSWSGFTAGITLGGLVASYIVPLYGWRFLLIIGGILPLALLPFIILLLPESLQFMLRNKSYHQKLQSVLNRIMHHQLTIDSLTLNSNNPTTTNPLHTLFSAVNRRMTLLLWVAFFTSLYAFYLLTYWIPILLSQDFDTRYINLIASMLPLGGTIGAITFALLIDRYKSSFLILSIAYFSAAIAMFAVEYMINNLVSLFSFVFFIGFTIAGAQNGLNLVAATIYPQHSKATGIAWAMASGRLGSLIGSIIGAWLIAYSNSLEGFFHHLAIITLMTSIAILGLFWRERRHNRST